VSQHEKDNSFNRSLKSTNFSYNNGNSFNNTSNQHSFGGNMKMNDEFNFAGNNSNINVPLNEMKDELFNQKFYDQPNPYANSYSNQGQASSNDDRFNRKMGDRQIRNDLCFNNQEGQKKQQPKVQEMNGFKQPYKSHNTLFGNSSRTGENFYQKKSDVSYQLQNSHRVHQG